MHTDPLFLEEVLKVWKFVRPFIGDVCFACIMKDAL
jgi:hypothetical protein